MGRRWSSLDDTPILKLVISSKKETPEVQSPLNPLARFKGLILNLTENALECLNQISRKEMEKNPPSPTLMEEYFLLHHYLDFIRRICKGKPE